MLADLCLQHTPELSLDNQAVINKARHDMFHFGRVGSVAATAIREPSRDAGFSRDISYFLKSNPTYWPVVPLFANLLDDRNQRNPTRLHVKRRRGFFLVTVGG
jgi:hypothetical protein